MAGAGDGLATYLVPLTIVLLVVVVRNRRPRRLRIESLWIWPLVYLVLLATSLASAPPPLTAASIGLIALGFVIGAALGWQRARFVEIHIHPETHDLTSRASPIGLVFIFAIFVMRYAARDFMAGEAVFLHLSLVAIGDAFLVLAVAMLSAQRLEVWRRATRVLAEAQAAKRPPPPPSLVS
jgi:hypothetical protein